MVPPVQRVLELPELLEQILLSLPDESEEQGRLSIRTLLRARGVSRSWRSLIERAVALRRRLYLPRPLQPRSNEFDQATRAASATTPPPHENDRPLPTPERVNPWINSLMPTEWGRRRSLLVTEEYWQGAYRPTEGGDASQARRVAGSAVEFRFVIGITAQEHLAFVNSPRGRQRAVAGWRTMLLTRPPVTRVWCGVGLRERGRRPIVRESYVLERKLGLTIGDLMDIAEALFAPLQLPPSPSQLRSDGRPVEGYLVRGCLVVIGLTSRDWERWKGAPRPGNLADDDGAQE